MCGRGVLGANDIMNVTRYSTATRSSHLMRQTAEQRLQKLYSQRAALEAQIKKIEAEKAKEVRKHQEKRERLVGQALYALIHTGDWNEAQLLEIMDAYLTRAKERALFDLSEPKTAPDTGKKKATLKAGKASAKQKSAARQKQTDTKAQPVTPSELQDEFNL